MPAEVPNHRFDYDPRLGSLKLNEKLDGTLGDLWYAMHTNARVWLFCDRFEQIKYDQNDNRIISLLSKIPSSRWHALCTAAGMTVYGAVALSWCEGAEIGQVWEGWEQSGFPLLPKPEYERPARFINPDLLPDTNSLKALSDLAENKSLPLCAMIVALQDKPLNFDMTLAQMKSANPQIASFLKSRMERKDDLTDEDRALIAHWSETVKGTEYEV